MVHVGDDDIRQHSQRQVAGKGLQRGDVLWAAGKRCHHCDDLEQLVGVCHIEALVQQLLQQRNLQQPFDTTSGGFHEVISDGK